MPRSPLIKTESDRLVLTNVLATHEISMREGGSDLYLTDYFGVGNVDGKLTVLHTAATTIFNRLGVAVEVVVLVVWR